MRNALAHAGRSGRRGRLGSLSELARRVADQLRPKGAKLAALMNHAAPDVLASLSFPPQRRTKLHSTHRSND